jgi:hypothetical protein
MPFVSSGKPIPTEWLAFLLWGGMGVIFWILNGRARRDLSEAERRRLIMGETKVVQISTAAAFNEGMP